MPGKIYSIQFFFLKKNNNNKISIFSIVKTDRVGSFDVGFHQVYLLNISEILTILLWNMNKLKSEKKSKNIF